MLCVLEAVMEMVRERGKESERVKRDVSVCMMDCLESLGRKGQLLRPSNSQLNG
ncbi:unnamed protein product [Dovyalis caffra]|uniref:Uncharacterized protein n=1 Tax=Dovyalis caffra TaxID=77055 RepID=A0AAV1S349_9ROSI|nr:unnamed protein product [Dovyalis caffra]